MSTENTTPTADSGRLPDAPCSPKNGAYCNAYGAIHLRIVSWNTDDPDWRLQTVDHGISIEEAHCIAMELMGAIHEASRMATGRANSVDTRP